jgi:hypothetical protein
VDTESANMEYFFMALYRLKCYPTENRLASEQKTTRKWSWDYTKNIQALKEEKENTTL